MTDTTSLPSRSEVPLEQTWDLASIFATPKDWEAACNQLTDMLPDLSAYRATWEKTHRHCSNLSAVSRKLVR